jgi:hypothetical protein|tara:strand:- start:310 stop:561 length:252 start_codon:yes stop_codon:yes gene_type:complete
MKIKDDVLDKWESGEWTIYDIAKYYGTHINAVVELLGLTRIDSSGLVTQDSEGTMEIHLDPVAEPSVKTREDFLYLSREDFIE